MGLAKDLDGHVRHTPTVERLLQTLPSEDGAALRRALTDHVDGDYRWSAGQLAARLQQDGHDLNKQQVIRWRRRNVTQ